MTARNEPELDNRSLDGRDLDPLTEEAVYLLRVIAASFERVALLFSGGKDSSVLAQLA
jgi:sulfate adenylyltransferase subunit 2